MPALKQAKILVTRPGEAGMALTKQLCGLGAKAYHLPTIAVEATLSQNEWPAIIQQTHHCMLAVFVSTTAIQYSQPMIEHWLATQPPLHVATLGQRSAEALHKVGITPRLIAPPPHNSESLLQQMQGIVHRGPSVLFRGQGGRRHLAEQLQLRYPALLEVACYQRTLPVICSSILERLREQNFDVIIAASLTSMQNVFTLYADNPPNWLTSAQWLVVSKRIAYHRPREIRTTPLIALPDNDSIVHTLTTWWKKQHGQRE